jgi:hypothetical protein
MNYRDFLERPAMTPPEVPGSAIDKWGSQLSGVSSLDEAESLALLRDFGIAANTTVIAEDENELRQAATKLEFPLVLKTAMPGIAHKSEHQGVRLNLGDMGQTIDAYRDVSERLGPRVAVAPMVDEGVDMILGARSDPQFGPVVMLGFGGVLAEVIGDVLFALPPFDAQYARRRLADLDLHPLLLGVRGRPAANIDAFCEMAATFSVMVDALGRELQEVDVNPVIVGSRQCVAVDALIISRKK